MEDPDLFECETCGNVGIGDGEIRCCDGAMAPVDREAPIEDPSLEDLLRSVFDMTETELEICLCVMEGGSLTVGELADRVGYDRSVVDRHLKHLAELGVVDRERRILRQGGHAYVYTPVSPAVVRERLTDAFLVWADAAATELAALRREKVETIADTGDDPAWQVFKEP